MSSTHLVLGVKVYLLFLGCEGGKKSKREVLKSHHHRWGYRLSTHLTPCVRASMPRVHHARKRKISVRVKPFCQKGKAETSPHSPTRVHRPRVADLAIAVADKAIVTETVAAAAAPASLAHILKRVIRRGRGRGGRSRRRGRRRGRC